MNRLIAIAWAVGVVLAVLLLIAFWYVLLIIAAIGVLMMVGYIVYLCVMDDIATKRTKELIKELNED